MENLQIEWTASTLDQNQECFGEYVRSLSSPYDNFLEDHVLQSDFYTLRVHGRRVGLMGIFKNEILTLFYVKKPYLRYSQQWFEKARKQFLFSRAYVPTCDELLLSLCLDQSPSVQLQAYFFTHGGMTVRPAELPRRYLRPAAEQDMPDLIAADFLDQLEKRYEQGQLYVLRDDKWAFMGLGVIEPMQIHTGYRGIGMYVHPDFRRQGVGRSIILHLSDMVRQNGKQPLPGCWYYNHNSKRTLESAGFVSKTRLLNMVFTPQDEEPGDNE